MYLNYTINNWFRQGIVVWRVFHFVGASKLALNNPIARVSLLYPVGHAKTGIATYSASKSLFSQNAKNVLFL